MYQASLLFSSKGWLNIHLDLINNYSFYGLVVGNDFLKPIVEDLIDSVQSEKQKLKMISNFIKRNVDWNGINDFLGDPPKKILELKTGTSGDINLLFASMLAKAGFDVTLVLLSTRDNGFVIDNFPSANQFNYVICLVNVDGQEILLDATDGMLPYDLLPEKCFNHKGLYVSPSGYGWIGIEPIAKDRTAITANLVLDESGNLTGHVRLTLGGYRAHSIRKERISENPLEYFEKQELSISNIKLESLLDIEKPVIAEGELTVNNSATIVSNSIFINPNIFISEKFNPFVAETRVFPVDFGNLTERIIILSIEYPENYIIDELPQNKIISLPLNSAKAVFNYSQNSNRITITTHFQINKTLFMQEEYPALREFYSRLIAKESESIVLKKRL